ncbi:MAG: 4a-hydroxytetrahydrobiopterin dehydratase [Deltaproteobacteria bacterium]|nr:4a-hydroxytetrahydrobiopterin dehydratase [Deltaproteobacteria bacterium]
MSQLTEEKCVACRADAPVVTSQEIQELKPHMPDWAMIEEDGIPKLDRLFKFRNFAQALAFTAAVGDIAEEEGHHPRIVTEWGRVRVTWWTHKIRNLHRNDFIMAAKTDGVYDEAG